MMRAFSMATAAGSERQGLGPRNQLFGCKAGGSGERVHVIAETGRSHASIAAILVDLIAGGFNQQQALVRRRLSKCGIENEWVCRTHGINAAGFACAILVKKPAHRVYWILNCSGAAAGVCLNCHDLSPSVCPARFRASHSGCAAFRC